MKLRALLVIVIAFAGISTAAHEASADKTLSQAEAAYNAGASLFAQGKYKDAAAKFIEAYEARAFNQFLFNIGACYEKLNDFSKAVEYYEKYLKKDPKATDRVKIEKRIKVLKAEAARIAAAAKAPPDPANPNKPPVTISKAVKNLGAVKIIKGLVVFESDPAGAFIYLDSRKKAPLGRTPWAGTLEGEHTIFIDRKGYKPVERRFRPDPNQLSVLIFTLAEQDYLGWVDIASNIPGASIYVDDKTVGVYRKTPFSGNMKPGKHTIWIHAEGYDWYKTTVDIIAGKTHKIFGKLKGSPVGYLNFRGRDIERTRIYLDGKVLCETPPCRKAIAQGVHTLKIKRSGYKTYTTKVSIRPKTETVVRPRLAKRPGRGDAIWAYVFAATFTGVGIWAGLEAKKLKDDLQTGIDNPGNFGNPPPDSDDPRFQRGKFFAIGADAAFALGGISFLTAIYYTFRDKGKPSTGTTDVRALALEPKFGPNYVGMGMSW